MTLVGSEHTSVVLAFRDVVIAFAEQESCKKNKEHAFQLGTYHFFNTETGETHDEYGMRCAYCRKGMIGRDNINDDGSPHGDTSWVPQSSISKGSAVD